MLKWLYNSILKLDLRIYFVILSIVFIFSDKSRDGLKEGYLT